MIAPASIVGFLLVFVATTVAASLFCASLFSVFHRRLKAFGPCVERRTASYGILLPPFLALVVTLVLAGRSLGTPWLNLHDHCPLHEHHLHLCLYHGGAWAQRAWAIALLAGVSALFTVLAAARVLRLLSTRRSLRDLIAVSTPLFGFKASVLMAKSRIPFCLVAGIARPRIVISSAAWDLLPDLERRAVIEHEITHIEQRDLLQRIVLEFASLLGVPLLTSRILSAWDHSTERLCDHRAATRVGEPAIVASALVRLARVSNRLAPSLGTAMFSTEEFIARVEALLAEEPDGQATARRLQTIARVLVFSIIVACIALADPLHHLAESLLG